MGFFSQEVSLTKLDEQNGVKADQSAEAEAEVIRFASEGNAEAFTQLYERYVDRIYNYIYYRTGNPHEAEDLTSRVFYRALHSIERYDQRGVPFAAWLYRIAHNLVANWHRDNSRRKEVPLEDTLQSSHRSQQPEAHVMDHQELETVLRAIRRMPAERQQLLILKFVEDLPNAEVALIMRRSEGAIKSLYHRTLLALRDELAKGE